jgi:hypothetical protein
MSEVDNQLRLSNKSEIDFACNVVRVLYHVIKRIKMEQRKTWKTDDLLHLMDTLIVEMATGVTEEDKQREKYLEKGKIAFENHLPRTANPYEKDSKQFTWWDTGWHDAERSVKKVERPGRIVKSKKTESQRHYKVQLNQKSKISEWNDVLHMYVNEGGGTLYEDYEETLALANRLKNGATGTVSVVTVEPEASQTVPQDGVIDFGDTPKI